MYCFVFAIVFIILMYFVTLDCKQRLLSRSPNFTVAFYEVPKKKIATTSVMLCTVDEDELKVNSALKISFLLRLLVLKISLSTSGLQRVSRHGQRCMRNMSKQENSYSSSFSSPTFKFRVRGREYESQVQSSRTAKIVANRS